MIYIFIIGILAPIVAITSFILMRLKYASHVKLEDLEYDSLSIFVQNAGELREYLVKVIRHLGKYIVQYTFHFSVRLLYWMRELLDFVYAKARNKFLRSAVKDKKAVSRFWEHLKEYRQEMDEEDR